MNTPRNIAAFFLLGSALFLMTSCCDCDELASDEELRLAILGKWVKEECEYPFTDSKDIIDISNILNEMTFNSDGTITEGGLYAYCCSSDCDTNQGTCRWSIENGLLTIIPDTISNMPHLNQSYPIKCINEEQLIFDNVIISGVKRRKACFQKH